VRAADRRRRPEGELIGLADNDPLGEMVVAACEAQDVQPVFHTVVQTYQIARSLVEAGAGTAVLDPFTAASAAATRCSAASGRRRFRSSCTC
jgi:hypothetical protein